MEAIWLTSARSGPQINLLLFLVKKINICPYLLSRKPSGLWLLAPVCRTVLLFHFCFTTEQSSYSLHQVFFIIQFISLLKTSKTMVKLTINSAEMDSLTAAPVPSSTAPAERRNMQTPATVPSSSSPEPEAVKSKVLLVCLSSLGLWHGNEDPAYKQVLSFCMHSAVFWVVFYSTSGLQIHLNKTVRLHTKELALAFPLACFRGRRVEGFPPPSQRLCSRCLYQGCPELSRRLSFKWGRKGMSSFLEQGNDWDCLAIYD